MNSLPNLSVEEGAMSSFPTNDEFGFENIPVYHLSSQEGETNDYNIDDYLKMVDISEPSESVDPTLSQLSLPKCPSLLSPLSVDTKAKPSKRKGASTASKPKKPTKGVRKPRKKRVDDTFKNVMGDLEDVSLHSFGPLQRCGDMLKKAKCRIVKAKATIVECDHDIRSGSMDGVALQELDARIASTKAGLIKMCEDADKLRIKITQKNQSAHCLKLQAEMELQESTKLFDTVASVRDKWRKEFDHAFQSDCD